MAVETDPPAGCGLPGFRLRLHPGYVYSLGHEFALCGTAPMTLPPLSHLQVSQHVSPGGGPWWEQRALPAALEISDWGDAAHYVLHPGAIRPDGEWEAAFFANWSPGARVVDPGCGTIPVFDCGLIGTSL